MFNPPYLDFELTKGSRRLLTPHTKVRDFYLIISN
jgi:hypothetical protein